MPIYRVQVTTTQGTTEVEDVEAPSPQEACDLIASTRPPGGPAASYTATVEE